MPYFGISIAHPLFYTCNIMHRSQKIKLNFASQPGFFFNLDPLLRGVILRFIKSFQSPQMAKDNYKST